MPRAATKNCMSTNMYVPILFIAVAAHLTSGSAQSIKNAHLQAEIDEWRRLGKPTQFAFRGSELSNLVGVPTGSHLLDSEMGDTDYQSNVFFYLFNRGSPNGTLVTNTPSSLLAAGYQTNRPTKIVIHGFETNISGEIFTAMVPALLHDSDCDVIGVDWGQLCPSPYYVEARSHVSGVGKLVASLVDLLIGEGLLRLKELHVIGHSLGAHVAGNVGKHLASGVPQRITGLDPALPLFLLIGNDRLGRGDAVVVDVVHTCSGLASLVEAIGDIDFYPNGGSHPQPGCELLNPGCSHQRAIKLLAESAWEKDSFRAELCETQLDATKGRCSNGTATAYMSVDLVYSVGGSYYLQTASTPPFDIQTHQAVN